MPVPTCRLFDDDIEHCLEHDRPGNECLGIDHDIHNEPHRWWRFCRCCHMSFFNAAFVNDICKSCRERCTPLMPTNTIRGLWVR